MELPIDVIPIWNNIYGPIGTISLVNYWYVIALYVTVHEVHSKLKDH